jgi:hypothetical protein
MVRKLFLAYSLMHLCTAAMCDSLPPELVPRKGLPNFLLKKLKNPRDTLAIAYLGGSITEAERGWRFDQWCYFLHTNFYFINGLKKGRHMISIHCLPKPPISS